MTHGPRGRSRRDTQVHCRICNKLMRNSQALGGHMNKHRAERAEEEFHKALYILDSANNYHLQQYEWVAQQAGSSNQQLWPVQPLQGTGTQPAPPRQYEWGAQPAALGQQGHLHQQVPPPQYELGAPHAGSSDQQHWPVQSLQVTGTQPAPPPQYEWGAQPAALGQQGHRHQQVPPPQYESGAPHAGSSGQQHWPVQSLQVTGTQPAPPPQYELGAQPASLGQQGHLHQQVPPQHELGAPHAGSSGQQHWPVQSLQVTGTQPAPPPQYELGAQPASLGQQGHLHQQVPPPQHELGAPHAGSTGQQHWPVQSLQETGTQPVPPPQHQRETQPASLGQQQGQQATQNPVYRPRARRPRRFP